MKQQFFLCSILVASAGCSNTSNPGVVCNTVMYEDDAGIWHCAVAGTDTGADTGVIETNDSLPASDSNDASDSQVASDSSDANDSQAATDSNDANDSQAATETGTETALDSGVDSGIDSPVETAVDSGTDSGIDSPVETAVDSGADSITDSAPADTHVCTWGFAPQVTYKTGASNNVVAIGNFDGNGRLGVLVGTNADDGSGGYKGELDRFQNSGQGLLAIGASYVTAIGGVSGMVADDVSGDGYSDVICSEYNGDSNGVEAYLNLQNGTWKADLVDGAVNGEVGIALGDLNGDGFLDLALKDAHSVGSFVGIDVFINTKASPYLGGTPASYPGTGGNIATVANLRGDSTHMDVVGGQGTNTIGVFLNSGTGTLGARTGYLTGNEPLAVAVGAFNADVYDDVAVFNYNDNTISVLINNGDGSGTFKPQKTYAADTVGGTLAAADINGDGKTDLLLMTNAGIDEFLGNGDGTFAAKTVIPNTARRSFAVGDLNGDGHPDLALIDGGSTLTILLSECQ